MVHLCIFNHLILSILSQQYNVSTRIKHTNVKIKNTKIHKRNKTTNINQATNGHNNINLHEVTIRLCNHCEFTLHSCKMIIEQSNKLNCNGCKTQHITFFVMKRSRNQTKNIENTPRMYLLVSLQKYQYINRNEILYAKQNI